MTAASASQPIAPHGRTRVTSRALDRIVTAVTADALDVDPQHVRVELADSAGALALHVSTPIGVVALPRITADPGVVARTGGNVLQRARNAQEQIRTSVAELTGSEIATVVVHLTGATIQAEARVQ
ncbi:putative alkaline shock family protein YloU [Leifsonia sp. EB34]